MQNRLPPAWSRHLKTSSGPKVQAPPKVKPAPSGPEDSLLLRRALEKQQAKDLAGAEDLCLRVLARTPNHPLALYILGTLAVGYDDEMALRYFARAVGEEPRNPYYHLSLSQTYLKVGEYTPAIRHLRHALELKPDLAEALCELGRAYVETDKAEMALPLYEKAIGIDGSNSIARRGLASALTSLGRMEDAGEHLRRAIELRIALPAAYNDFAHSRKFTEKPVELASILTELSDPRLDLEGARQLHHAAGKILNDLQRYEEAVEHFKKGKQAAAHKFDLESYRSWVDSMIDVFSPEMLAGRTSYGSSSEVPVFVLGMPRSGTTLTEQICASHPSVHGAGELSKLRRIANGIGLRTGATETLRRTVLSITPELSSTLAAEHLSYLRELAPNALRVVDKTPHNFELIGLICLLFPRARIIHCRRDAIDNCVSCFALNFSEEHSYNSDLRVLGLYYREYDRLMSHWKKVFPGRMLESRYETLIADQEAQSRRLIDYLGLPWDEACLRFFERDGSVNTPSRWQVRQPIYTSSVKRWKNYETQIQPLIQSLGDLADI